MIILIRESLITVCASCRMASCWHGEFMCEESKGADLAMLPISDLMADGLEDSSHWRRQPLVQGEVSSIDEVTLDLGGAS